MHIGIDEVGRGPIAGPVTVCGFMRDPKILTDDMLLALFPKNKLRDSKKLTAKHRIAIVDGLEKLKDAHECTWSLASRSAHEIDGRGISTCIKECIKDVLATCVKESNLSSENLILFLDGSLHAPTNYIRQETIIKGDEKIIEIACASIVAKVSRDNYMGKISEKFPHYGFENHVGYGTKAHYEAIKKNGLTELHRKSYTKAT